MNALSTNDYDLRHIETEEDDIDVKQWDLISAIYPNKVYKLVQHDPIEYYDYRLRFIVSDKRDKSEPKYAYCL